MTDGVRFLDALEKRAKVFFPSAKACTERHSEICGWLLDPLARWGRVAYGPDVYDIAVKGYAQYCMHVAQAQLVYEKEGRYTPDRLPDIIERVYENDSYMTPYMWAAVLIYGFWESMVSHVALFRDEFIRPLPQGGRVLEMACGHGAMGLLVCEERSDVELTGIDIGPAAIRIAQDLASASGHAARARFSVGDVLGITHLEGGKAFDGIIAAMVAEHLTDPRALLRSISTCLADDGLAFVSTAVQSPQVDHVFEFRKESELLCMAEDAGLRVTRLVSDGAATRPAAKFRPRAEAMILRQA